MGSLKNSIKNTKAKLEYLMNSSVNSANGEKINKTKALLEKLSYKEEIHWQQRSRNTWLTAGDRNTSYFHKYASERRKPNSILSLSNDQGILMTDQRDIENIIISYYDSLFTSNHPTDYDFHKITSLIDPKVSEETNNFLLTPFTKEVRKALFYLHPFKALGLDGFTALFFQKAWDTIGGDVIRESLDILNQRKKLIDMNQTVVTLIPKTKNASSMKDFRPISLCNITYKIVVKAITNRFKGVLDSIIDPMQSAFVPGRAITDNVILGFECMHWLKKL